MRLTTFLVTLVISAGIVVGLNGVLFSQERVSFTHWTLASRTHYALWNTIEGDFEKEYPSIKVERHEIPGARYWDQLIVLVSAGPAPDVMGAIPLQVKQFAAMEALEPLDDLMDLSEVKRTFSEQQITFCIEDGKTYSIISGSRPLVLIYNEKLFEEAGIKEPPIFPPEWLCVSMKLTKPEKNQYGIGLRVSESDYMDTYDCLVNFPAGYGASFAEKGVPTANDQNTILGIKLLKLFCDLKLTPAGVDQKVMRGMFYKEQLAQYIDGPWLFTEAAEYPSGPETVPHLNTAMVPFANKACVGGAHHFWVVPTLAKNKSAAGKFVEFCTREKYQRMYSEVVGVIPGNPKFTSEKLLKERWFRAYKEGMKYAVMELPEGFAPIASEFAHIVVRHVVGGIILRGEPLEETMEKCQQELLKLKEKM